MRSIPRGYRVTHRLLVEERMTVDFEQQEPGLGKLHGVYATYWLARHFEMVSRKLSLPYLEADEEGIGFELSVRHFAPALPGTGLELEARHVATEGNRLHCECRATDDFGELVGEGATTQVVLNRSVLEEKFAARGGTSTPHGDWLYSGMTEATRLESFELDHTRVRAPYVRLAGEYQGPRGDTVRKFDLRMVQPNQAEVPTAALHTIEHLFAGYLRESLGDRVVDASPMGCRTGFYLTVLGETSEDEVRSAFRAALEKVAAHEGEIPGCSELQCGNYRDHSLHGAKSWAQRVLERDIVVQPTIPLGAR